MSYYNCCCTTDDIFTLHAKRCNSTNYAGVTVAVSGIGSATTDADGNAMFNVPPGTYTVTLTDPNGIVIVFTLVMGAYSQTVTKNFITTLSATVRNVCPPYANPLSGATVTFKKAGATVGTATTNSSGVATCTTVSDDVTGATVTASTTYKGTANSCTFVPNASCTMSCSIGYRDSFTVTVRGCNSLPLAGATVTIAGGTATTNSSGVAVVTPATGVIPGTSVTVNVSKARFISGSTTTTTCSASLTLAPDTSDYQCIPDCSDPLSITLTLTDPFGTVTLNYDATYGGWVGCDQRLADRATNGTPATNCVSTPNVDVPIQYGFLPPSDLYIAVPDCVVPGFLAWPLQGSCSTQPPGGTDWPSYSDTVLVPQAAVISRSLDCPTAFVYTIVMRFHDQFFGGGGTLSYLRVLHHVYGTTLNRTFTITE